MSTFTALRFIEGVLFVREVRTLEVFRAAFGTRRNPNRITRSIMDDLVVSRHDGTVQKIIGGGVKQFRISLNR